MYREEISTETERIHIHVYKDWRAVPRDMSHGWKDSAGDLEHHHAAVVLWQLHGVLVPTVLFCVTSSRCMFSFIYARYNRKGE